MKKKVFVMRERTGQQEEIDTSEYVKSGRMYYPLPVSLSTLRHAFRGPRGWRAHKIVSTKDGNWYQEQSKIKGTAWSDWDRNLALGKSYLMGSKTPDAVYLKRHRSPLSGWQKVAYHYALAHPDKTVFLENDANDWQVNACGDYVIFALPHHCRGGERHYVSRNGRSKICINID